MGGWEETGGVRLRRSCTCLACAHLQPAISAHKQILRLQIPVHNAPRMAERESPHALEQVTLDEEGLEHASAGLHVLFEVAVKELEDEVQIPV